jgi:hypothetical protein
VKQAATAGDPVSYSDPYGLKVDTVPEEYNDEADAGLFRRGDPGGREQKSGLTSVWNRISGVRPHSFVTNHQRRVEPSGLMWRSYL